MLDLQGLQEAIDRNLRPALFGPPPAAATPPPDGATAEYLQELVEDMLDLLRRVQSIEAGQADVVGRLDRLEQSLRDGLFLQARETDGLRRDLLGEHQALAARVTFEAVLPVLDKLRPLRAALSPRRNEALVNQLDAVLEVLAGMLRALGFTAFEPALGEPFDPQRMRCVGQKKGVLGVEQPGYLARQTVVRPAGVLLALAPSR